MTARREVFDVLLARLDLVRDRGCADAPAGAERLAGSVCPQARAEGLRALIVPHDLDDELRVGCF
jgi:hypothetical protein